MNSNNSNNSDGSFHIYDDGKLRDEDGKLIKEKKVEEKKEEKKNDKKDRK